MTRTHLALIVLALATLACMEQVATPTPTPSPVPPTAAATATPEPTRTPEPTATAEASGEVVQTAIVRQPTVRVRVEPDGAETGEYVYAGQEVTVLETVTLDDGGEWVRIAEPEGWIFGGCLQGSDRGCVAE